MSTSIPHSFASTLAALRSQIPTPEPGPSGAPLAGTIAPLRSEDSRSPADAGQHDTQNSLRSEAPRSSADAGETPPSAFGGTRRRDAWTPFLARTGRPAIFTPELVTEIAENIERYGMSDTSAARNAGVSSSTISRWKQEVPQFGEFLDEARDAFELEQLHRIEVFKRKDGQCDPYCSRWLLQKGIPEKYGPASRRCGGERNSGCGANGASSTSKNSEHGTRNSPRSEVSRGPDHAGETASKKSPKPGTPEFWATVEEEPLPRNLSTCIMTPGRVKFYSTIHLVSMPYRPDIDPNEPSGVRTPEQRQAGMEALFTLQETYFSLPKEERLPYLHHVLEQEFGKVLSPEERAATDALFGGPVAASSSETEADGITGTASRHCGRASSERGESSFPDPVAPTPGPSSFSSSQTPENLPKTPAVAVGHSQPGTPPQPAAPPPPAAPSPTPPSAQAPFSPSPALAALPKVEPGGRTLEEYIAHFHQLSPQERERLMRQSPPFVFNTR